MSDKDLIQPIDPEVLAPGQWVVWRPYRRLSEKPKLARTIAWPKIYKDGGFLDASERLWPCFFPDPNDQRELTDPDEDEEEDPTPVLRADHIEAILPIGPVGP